MSGVATLLVVLAQHPPAPMVIVALKNAPRYSADCRVQKGSDPAVAFSMKVFRDPYRSAAKVASTDERVLPSGMYRFEGLPEHRSSAPGTLRFNDLFVLDRRGVARTLSFLVQDRAIVEGALIERPAAGASKQVGTITCTIKDFAS